jgi:NAD(P) transhydrogenase subunit alpha
LLYARNLYAFLESMVDKTTKTVAVNPDDELVKATLLTHGGAVVHANFAPAAPVAAPVSTTETVSTEPGLDAVPEEGAVSKAALTDSPEGAA